MGPAILYILEQYPKGYKFTAAEVGVAQANNAKYWCKSIPFQKLVLIDNCSDEHKFGNCKKEECVTEIGKILLQYSFTIFHLLDSVEATKLYQDEYFDFVYLDADHTYNGLTADLDAWKNKIKKGGYISGHDYDPADNVKLGFDYVNDAETMPDHPLSNVFHVKPAVQHFCERHRAECIYHASGDYTIRRTW